MKGQEAIVVGAPTHAARAAGGRAKYRGKALSWFGRAAVIGGASLMACRASRPPEPRPAPSPAVVQEAFTRMANATTGTSFDRKQAAEAARLFAGEAARAPDDAKVQFGLAWALHRSGEIEQAEAQYVKTAALAARHGQLEIEFFAREYLGALYLERHEAERAVRQLERATVLAARSKPAATNGAIPTCIGDRAWLAWADLARADEALGLHDQAIAAYGEASKRKPLAVEPYLERAALEMKVGQRDRAEADWKEAARLDPSLARSIDALRMPGEKRAR